MVSLFASCGIALYQFTKINRVNGLIHSSTIKQNSSGQARLGIHTPLNKEVEFFQYEFDATNGIEFHQPTGTHIIIPKNALIDTKGKLVTGKVVVKFREFHDSKSIFLSGIPMQTDTNRNLFLEST